MQVSLCRTFTAVILTINDVKKQSLLWAMCSNATLQAAKWQAGRQAGMTRTQRSQASLYTSRTSEKSS